MRAKLITLRMLSGGAPEQWEGLLENGDQVYARERNDTVRIEVNGYTVSEKTGSSAFDGLSELFDLPPYCDECSLYHSGDHPLSNNHPSRMPLIQRVDVVTRLIKAMYDSAGECALIHAADALVIIECILQGTFYEPPADFAVWLASAFKPDDVIWRFGCTVL